jgi:N-formylglutamate amidohydrolase
MDPFRITRPEGPRVPVVVSIPHCGTLFPEDLKGAYVQSMVDDPDDTDWFVDRLYGFAPRMGITLITSVYCRYVIDLNRDLAQKPLYSDGRLITGLCPTTDFMGNALYEDGRSSLAQQEVEARKQSYYLPYHRQLRKLLDELKEEFGIALLWDAHSIRRQVPTIQPGPFPDLILGSVDGTSASPGLIELALSTLDHSKYAVSHNHPFKGGAITRSFGQPALGFHALQLEMSKNLYMGDSEKEYDEQRAAVVQQLLESTFDKVITQLLA